MKAGRNNDDERESDATTDNSNEGQNRCKVHAGWRAKDVVILGPVSRIFGFGSVLRNGRLRVR